MKIIDKLMMGKFHLSWLPSPDTEEAQALRRQIISFTEGITLINADGIEQQFMAKKWPLEEVCKLPNLRSPFEVMLIEHSHMLQGVWANVPSTRGAHLVVNAEYSDTGNRNLMVFRVMDKPNTCILTPPEFYQVTDEELINPATKGAEYFFNAGDGTSAAMPFFVISLLNCSNVELVPDASDNRAERRDRQLQLRKLGLDPILYKTLIVRPGTRSSRNSSSSLGDAESKRLHLCRGHFKRFDSRPLFGKLHGTYWWPSHARGDIGKGIVDKDYALSASPSPALP